MPCLHSVVTHGIEVLDESLMALASSKTLKKINIDLCGGLSEDALIYFVTHCKTIETLGYGNQQNNMTDDTLDAIAEYGKNIKRLNISTSFSTTDEGISKAFRMFFDFFEGEERMIQNMPNLEVLIDRNNRVSSKRPEENGKFLT